MYGSGGRIHVGEFCSDWDSEKCVFSRRLGLVDGCDFVTGKLPTSPPPRDPGESS